MEGTTDQRIEALRTQRRLIEEELAALRESKGLTLTAQRRLEADERRATKAAARALRPRRLTRAERFAQLIAEQDEVMMNILPPERIRELADAIQAGWSDVTRYSRSLGISQGKHREETDGESVTVGWTVPEYSIDGAMQRRGFTIEEDPQTGWDFCGRCIGNPDD